jgi:hypothetical protein
LDWPQSLDGCGADTARTERTAGRADAGGDSAHGAHLDPLHVLVTEPFLVVGLIASIRRILVISLEIATLTKEATWSNKGASIFRASMIELGLIGALVFVLVFSIAPLRRYPPITKDIPPSSG